MEKNCFERPLDENLGAFYLGSITLYLSWGDGKHATGGIIIPYDRI